MALDLARDEREQPLGVGVARDERAVVAELALEPLELEDHAVVGEQPAALLERVRVGDLEPAGGRVADVGEEDRDSSSRASHANSWSS